MSHRLLQQFGNGEVSQLFPKQPVKTLSKSRRAKRGFFSSSCFCKPLLFLLIPKSNRPLEQSPLHANPEQGQSVNITCELKSSHEEEKFYLFRTHVQPGTVLSVSNLSRSEVSPAFGNRLEYSREGNRIVVILHKLQEKDSDNYICAQEVKGSALLSARGTMVLVKGITLSLTSLGRERNFKSMFPLPTDDADGLLRWKMTPWLGSFQVKKYFQRKKPNEVYEDMSYNSRRSTLVRTNTYSRGE
uniref:Immunoglobulin domain-containing protein n=1 Tax=Zonotrichia albicollis TaxID=44394 RepID=A0A8D2QG60_ZONAL